MAHLADSSPFGVACIANIGPGQRARRLAWGMAALLGAVALLVILLLGGAPRPARLLVALPFWAGLLGVLQAKGKT